MSRFALGPLAAMALSGFVVSGPGLAVQPGPSQGSPPREISAPPGGGAEAVQVVPRGNPSEVRVSRPAGAESVSPNGRRISRPVVQPEALPRCPEMPTVTYWEGRQRDVLASIKRMARKGLLLALRLPDEVSSVQGVAQRPAGWSAYGIAVPGKKTVRVSLEHPNLGWFGLRMIDKWGSPEKGMLQNLVKTGRTEVSFVNPLDEVKVVYVIVDDPGWLSTEQVPFVMTVARSWRAGEAGPDSVKRSHGIWANLDPVVEKDGATAN